MEEGQLMDQFEYLKTFEQVFPDVPEYYSKYYTNCRI